MFDITENGRTLLNTTRDDALARGFSEGAVDAAEASARLLLVKAECKRRIYAHASQETQANMSAVGVVIGSKLEAARSVDEVAILAGLTSGVQWIGAMRAVVPVLTADPTADFTDDTYWPAIPADAATVAAQF